MTEQKYVEDDFTRDTDYLEDRITADGRDGWPVEPGRYRLVVARACPWANRSIIVRRLLGLEDAISMGLCGPTHDARSWTFDLDPGGRDPVLGIERLQEAFLARDPDYSKGITVPALVDVPTGQVVTNNFPQMTIDLSLEWTAHHRDGAPELYPEAWRDEIDEINAWVYTEVNNGVYRCGFAGKQASYERAYDRLFAALDRLEERLTDRRYLVGDPGPLRRGLPRALQVQPQQADRDAGPLGLRPRPVPDTRLRRHDRLRADQAALLRRALRHQPDPDRAQGPGPVELAHPARPRAARRTTLR
jgi:putative glutathione S-transferase